MSAIALALALVAFGYLLGAIPVGLLIGRMLGGPDLRQSGSRRTGATNVLRTVGSAGAAAVFVLDVAKGALPVLTASAVFGGTSAPAAPWVAAAAGTAAIIGHVHSVFIGFAGGRGVATSAGALLAMSPWSLAVLAPIVLVIIWRTRYVSLGSISGALLAPIVTAALFVTGAVSGAAVALAMLAAALVTWSHADNIARLRSGNERRLGEKEVATSHG